MAIRIDTTQYEASHGHTPRQPRQQASSAWAFQIDDKPEPVCINNTYKLALAQAKAWAQYTVTVLP
jgi:hypothetical protein